MDNCRLLTAKKRLEDDREEEILERACNWILRIGHPVIVSIIDAAISRLEYLSLFAPPNLSDLLESFDQSNIPTMELLRRWINLLLSRCEVNRKWKYNNNFFFEYLLGSNIEFRLILALFN